MYFKVWEVSNALLGQFVVIVSGLTGLTEKRAIEVFVAREDALETLWARRFGLSLDATELPLLELQGIAYAEAEQHIRRIGELKAPENFDPITCRDGNTSTLLRLAIKRVSRPSLEKLASLTEDIELSELCKSLLRIEPIEITILE